ncbi:hypothetical protein [Pectobacterium brasiliense]|uniref:hypothetical protein n=1 Tax=Pectobacterium brasiliense TaxID=180957 RepID=UPI00300E2B89
MIVSEQPQINGNIYPFHLSQKPNLSEFCDFLLSQTFDGDNGHHSCKPEIKNQALNALAKSLGYPQFSVMMAKAKKHQQQLPSNIAIVDHPGFLALLPLHYAEAMQPHIQKIPFATPIPKIEKFLKELGSKQLHFRLQKNANETFSATIAAKNAGWYQGWNFQLPKLALTSRDAFFTVILEWYHTLVNMGYYIDFNRNFVIENAQLFNIFCPPDLIRNCVSYQQYWNSLLPLNAEIETNFAHIDQSLNEHIRQVENSPYNIERYGPISLKTHIVRFNKNGLVIPNAYFISEKLRNLQLVDQRPIVLMDICTIKYIEKYKKIEADSNTDMQERVKQLSALVDKGYRFSFLLVIIEKATDYQNSMNSDELIARTIKDYGLIADFIGKENIIESPLAIEKMIPVLMDENYKKEERAELSIPSSLKLLEFFNELRVTNTPAASQRFKLAKQVAMEGKRLGLTQGYPTIMICIASIYECIDARKVLKIRGKGKEENKYNPSNSLGDIMSFYRVAKAKSKIKSVLGNVDVIFRTEDKYLENLHQYIKVTEISSSNNTSVLHSQISHPEKLFPKLYKNEECINEQERDDLFALLNFKVN